MESLHSSTCFGRSANVSRKSSFPRGPPGRRGLHITCGESRIGKRPIPVPANVKTKLEGQFLQVEGPKGKLEWTFPEDVSLELEGANLVVKRILSNKKSKAMHGLARSLCNNMVVGVSEGFTKTLEMIGVGYKASTSGKQLTLNVGFCHPVIMDIPDGIEVQVEKNTILTISGYDKAVLGNFCAVIRKHRPPEPYKGKGIRYSDEIVRMKEGKKGK